MDKKEQEIARLEKLLDETWDIIELSTIKKILKISIIVLLSLIVFATSITSDNPSGIFFTWLIFLGFGYIMYRVILSSKHRKAREEEAIAEWEEDVEKQNLKQERSSKEEQPYIIPIKKQGKRVIQNPENPEPAKLTQKQQDDWAGIISQLKNPKFIRKDK